MLLLIGAPVLASGADDFHYFRDEAGEHSLGGGGGGVGRRVVPVMESKLVLCQ